MNASQRFRIKHNVILRVLDSITGKRIREYVGHNTATDTLIEGVGHYLAGEGIFHQGQFMLAKFVPRYISLGTMGLANQDEDENGLPLGISGYPWSDDKPTRYQDYVDQRPGYSSDRSSTRYNNNRPYYGLGIAYTTFSVYQSYHTGDIVYYNGEAYRATEDMIAIPEEGIYNYWDTDKWKRYPSEDSSCYELISSEFPRQEISFRDVIPESELNNKTVNVIFSAMISSRALRHFHLNNSDNSYIFISEVGLWSQKDYQPDDVGYNGLLAGYRLAPSDPDMQYMKSDRVPLYLAYQYWKEQGVDTPTDAQIQEAKDIIAASNREQLPKEILRVESDQVVQVIWKIEIGNVED